MSYLQHSREAIDRVAQTFAGAQAQVQVTVRDVNPVGNGFARIVAQASAACTPEQVMSSMRRQFDGIAPIAGSFITVARNAASHIVEGIVAVMPERVVLSDENRHLYKAVAGNMFADGDEGLWTLKATDSGQILIKTTCEDNEEVMGKLLALCSSNVNDFESGDILRNRAEIRASVEGGDLISFVSPNKQSVEMGIVTASVLNEDGSDTFAIGVVRPDGGHELIDRELIVACAEHEMVDDETEDAVAVASGTIDIDSIAAYYARMFARRPEYYEAFMSRFRAHAFM